MVALDVEVCIAWRFQEATLFRIHRARCCAIGEADFSGCYAKDGTVLLMQFIDERAFVADIGVVVSPERGETAYKGP